MKEYNLTEETYILKEKYDKTMIHHEFRDDWGKIERQIS